MLFAHGDHFSAGLDLAEIGPAVADHGPQVLCGSHRFDPFGVWGDPVPKPVVMAVNVFCMAGTELYRAILEDVAEVHRRIPRERMRYALETPYIARENSTAEILALRGQFITRLSRGSGFFRRTQVQRSSRPATASTTPTATRKSCRRVPLRPSLPPACRQFEALPWYPK